MARAPRLSILTICTANICRSPLAQILLTAHLDSERFDVASAGVRGWDDHPMDPSAAVEVRRMGHVSKTFRSRAVTSQLVDSADLVLTATRSQRSEILSLNPRALHRTFTLQEFTALASTIVASDPADLIAQAARRRSHGPKDADIADPFRRGPEAHRHAAEQISAAVLALSDRLNGLVFT